MWKILKPIMSLIYIIRDSKVAFWKKAIILGSVIYLFSPIDIFPDFFLPVGFLDDILVFLLIFWGFGKDLRESFVRGSEKHKINKMKKKGADYSGRYKETIEDVDFEVKED